MTKRELRKTIRSTSRSRCLKPKVALNRILCGIGSDLSAILRNRPDREQGAGEVPLIAENGDYGDLLGQDRFDEHSHGDTAAERSVCDRNRAVRGTVDRGRWSDQLVQPVRDFRLPEQIAVFGMVASHDPRRNRSAPDQLQETRVADPNERSE